MLPSLNIAISVPDHLFRRAEQAARRMRLPRSQFYARAVGAYLTVTAREGSTKRLNAVYSEELSFVLGL